MDGMPVALAERADRADGTASSLKGRILVVDDHPDMLQLLAQILEAAGYQTCLAGSGMEALWCAVHQPLDLILLDVRMPGMNGLEVARLLRGHAATASAPIIIVSAADSPADRIAGFAAGAVDFISKPFVDEDVLARIDTHLQMSQVCEDVLRQRQAARLGGTQPQGAAQTTDAVLEELLAASVCATLLLDAQGCTRYANPVLLQWLGQTVETFSPALSQLLASLGRVQANELRCKLPGLPVSCNAHIARLPVGQADSTVASTPTHTHTQASRIVVFSPETVQAQAAIAQDSPLFQALASFATQSASYPGLEASIRDAVRQQELRLLYQPIFDLTQMRPLALEALLRWQHPRHGLLAPHQFLATADETGEIVAIGHWVFDQAGQQLARWQQAEDGHAHGHVHARSIAINLDALQLGQEHLVAEVAALIERYRFAPAQLMIEVAAASLLEDMPQGMAMLQRLKALGVTLTLDRYRHDAALVELLSRLPVDIIKLEPTLLRSLDHTPQQPDILRDLVDLAHALGKRVIAHGIEQDRHLALLSLCQCDMGQGYLLGVPAVTGTYFPADGHG